MVAQTYPLDKLSSKGRVRPKTGVSGAFAGGLTTEPDRLSWTSCAASDGRLRHSVM